MAYIHIHTASYTHTVYLNQGSQTQINWGPLDVESGSGWAFGIKYSSIPKKVAQLIQCSQSLLLMFLLNCFSEVEHSFLYMIGSS